MKPDWKTFDTAPKGTRIMLYGTWFKDNTAFMEVGFFGSHNARSQDAEWYVGMFTPLKNVGAEVTHWAPLPEGP